MGALLWEQCRELLGMPTEEIEGEFGVGGIILGARWNKRFTIAREHRRIDREQHEAVVLLQCIDERSLVEFQRDGDWTCAEALAQRVYPLIDRFGAMCQHEAFTCSCPFGQQTDVVLGIAPIDADTGSERCCSG